MMCTRRKTVAIGQELGREMEITPILQLTVSAMTLLMSKTDTVRYYKINRCLNSQQIVHIPYFLI